jgi:hypothetical protein
MINITPISLYIALKKSLKLRPGLYSTCSYTDIQKKEKKLYSVKEEQTT